MPFLFLGFPLFLLFGEGNSYMYVCMYVLMYVSYSLRRRAGIMQVDTG